MKKSKKVTYSKEVLKHLKKYWQLSIRLFEEYDYALATFFSITLIEEVGKIIYINRHKLAGIKKIYKKPIYNHNEKYIEAILFSLPVNSRVARIYKEQEHKFAKWLIKKTIFKIRNKSLYLDLVESKFQTPGQVISKEDAFLFVCFAGEIFAEVQGSILSTSPENWQEIINQIDDFRKRYQE